MVYTITDTYVQSLNPETSFCTDSYIYIERRYDKTGKMEFQTLTFIKIEGLTPNETIGIRLKPTTYTIGCSIDICLCDNFSCPITWNTKPLIRNCIKSFNPQPGWQDIFITPTTSTISLCLDFTEKEKNNYAVFYSNNSSHYPLQIVHKTFNTIDIPLRFNYYLSDTSFPARILFKKI